MSGRTFNLGVPLPEYIDDEDSARRLLYTLQRKVELDPHSFIGYDTETTGKTLDFTVGNSKPLNWMVDTVIFWSLAAELEDGYHRWCISREYLEYFTPFLENPALHIAGWNAKYDGHVSWNSGVHIWNAVVFDGLAMAHLHDENRRQYTLKTCARDWCGLHMTPYSVLFDRDKYGNKAKEHETSLFDLPLENVIDYASYDAYAHLRVCEWLKDRLKDTPIDHTGYNLWEYFQEVELEFTHVLWKMERRGIAIDTGYLDSKIPILTTRITELEREVNRLAGKPINVNSPKQLSALFFGHAQDPDAKKRGMGLKVVKKTKGGAPSVDEEVLTLLEEAGVEMAIHVVNCRKLYKMKNTYVETLSKLAKAYPDKRIHPNFHQFGARTGRLSTSVPNSQNFPRPDNDEYGVRRSVVAAPGFVLIVVDQEQVEMRIMADRSQDQNMINAIRDGKDLHSYTVSRIVPGVSYEEAAAAKKAKSPDARQKMLQALRQDYKKVGFGIIYGAGPGKISEEIEISEEDIAARAEELLEDSYTQKRIQRKMRDNPAMDDHKALVRLARESIAADKIAAYFGAFPGVKRYMDTVPDECRDRKKFTADAQGRRGMRHDVPEVRTPGAIALTESGHTEAFGYVQTIAGRYRRLPDIDSNHQSLRGHAEREAVNTCIQGSSADLIRAAMLRVEASQELKMLRVRLLNQVHDELVFEAPIENAERAAPIIRECMEHPFAEGEDPLCVPTPVDLKIVPSWDLAK